MKVIGVITSGRNGSVSTQAVNKVLEGAKEKGYEVKVYNLNSGEFKGCFGCGTCKNNGTNCIHNDILAPYWDDLKDADVVVFGTPCYMGTVNGQMWQFINRHYCLRKVDGVSRIPAGKKLIGIFSQGFSNLDAYVGIYSGIMKIFTAWGFVLSDPVVVRQELDDVAMEKINSVIEQL